MVCAYYAVNSELHQYIKYEDVIHIYPLCKYIYIVTVQTCEDLEDVTTIVRIISISPERAEPSFPPREGVV